MNKYLRFSLLAVTLLITKNLSALGLAIEPIVGYEMVQKLVPTQHTTSRLTYGARLILGLPLIGLESEYTRGTDSETFAGLTTKDTADRVKLGLRSGIGLGNLIRFIVRGGVQASQNTHLETPPGSKVITPVDYKPYAGLGLRASLTRMINASIEVVSVFNDFPNMSKNEYQTTAGFSISIL